MDFGPAFPADAQASEAVEPGEGVPANERGLARLIHHEVNPLYGLTYLSRMRTGVEAIPVEEYHETGRAWAYEQ